MSQPTEKPSLAERIADAIYAEPSGVHAEIIQRKLDAEPAAGFRIEFDDPERIPLRLDTIKEPLAKKFAEECGGRLVKLVRCE